MLHNFFEWLQTQWGVDPNAEFGMSYSQILLGSSNFWGLMEGTHLLMLMLFFGTILFVDLRLLGVSFRKTPVSVLSDKVLPLTVVSFLIVIATGLIVFLSKPEEYWHNVWFRLKMIILALAIINIVVFHKMVQKNQAEWDTAGSTPAKAKISAIISIVAWIGVITCGRFIAYNWLECGKPHSDFINAFAACEVSSYGSMTIEEGLALEAEMNAIQEAPAMPPPADNDVFGGTPSFDDAPADESSDSADIFGADPSFEEEGQ